VDDIRNGRLFLNQRKTNWTMEPERCTGGIGLFMSHLMGQNAAHAHALELALLAKPKLLSGPWGTSMPSSVRNNFVGIKTIERSSDWLHGFPRQPRQFLQGRIIDKYMPVLSRPPSPYVCSNVGRSVPTPQTILCDVTEQKAMIFFLEVNGAWEGSSRINAVFKQGAFVFLLYVNHRVTASCCFFRV
jgi:hypothetical protein